MAFGSWFKNIIKKTGQFINKLKPYIGKAVHFANQIAPVIGTIGDSIGGNVGTGLRTIADGTQKYTGRINNMLAKNAAMDNTNKWIPNEHAKGFNMPLLK